MHANARITGAGSGAGTGAEDSARTSHSTSRVHGVAHRDGSRGEEVEELADSGTAVASAWAYAVPWTTVAGNLDAFAEVVSAASSRALASWGRREVATCFNWGRYFETVRRFACCLRMACCASFPSHRELGAGGSCTVEVRTGSCFPPHRTISFSACVEGQSGGRDAANRLVECEPTCAAVLVAVAMITSLPVVSAEPAARPHRAKRVWNSAQRRAVPTLRGP